MRSIDQEGVSMTKRQAGNRKVNRRYRRAAERIWENSSLRDELNDDQARRLLDWGSLYLKKVAGKTAGLTDDDADQMVEDQTIQVSNVIRQVNQLARGMTSGDPQEFSERLQALKNSLAGLTDVPGQLTTTMDQLGASPEGDQAQVFEELMIMLDGEEE
jgi:hypothetical protein